MPEFGLVQFHFGSLETSMRSDQELQVAALQRAIQLLPKLGRAHGELARIYVQLGTPEKALPETDRALELEPEFADQFMATRAEALLAMSKFDDATKTIKIAAALPHTDRGVNYALKTSDMAKRVEEIRREGDARRLAELRSQVEAQVAEREPPRLPPPPPPPPRSGGIEYEVQARVATQILTSPLPVYPAALIQKGTAGSITVQVNVGADGRVTQATIAASQVAELNTSTLEAVKRWTFKPATSAGKAVPFDARIVLRFTVQ
jgi:TonB family protein